MADPMRRAVLTTAAVGIGGVLLARLLRTAGADRVTEALMSAGADVLDRTLSVREREVKLELAPVGDRPAAPILLPEAIAGAPVSLVHLWASWCPPCLDELPALVALAQHPVGRRFRILAVTYDDDWAAATAVLQRVVGSPAPAGIVWLRDPAGQVGDPEAMLRVRMGTDQLPETYAITADRLRARFVAAQHWTEPGTLRALEALAPG
ncbi:MAG: TlpA family protein disulfide reductase [Myxococcales bacterium]|nr:TlpA family protein disulfide reductase [Myxococcales bacterium]